jgi:hypothetical protein
MIKNHKIALNDLWWVPAVVPLLLVIMSFFTSHWYWGLMDDMHMVIQHGSVIERTAYLFKILLGTGRFVPISCFHWALLYKIFENSPTTFFLFRWFEGIAALGILGCFVIDATGKKWSAWVFMTVAMGFYKFYDGFLYLSIPEFLGVLFIAPATLFFFRALKPALDEGKNVDWKLIALSFFFLLLSIGTKETFIVVPVAFGLTVLLFSLNNKNTKSLLAIGGGLLFLSICYALIVKFFLIRGYSSDYGMTNISKLTDNIRTWLKNDLPCHSPWILISVLLLAFGGKPVMQKTSHRFALILSILLYIGYTVILLPWNTWEHYCLPLGVFFALTVSIAITNQLERINGVLWSVIFSIILCFNIFVSTSAIQWHRTYQNDTKNLEAQDYREYD